MYFEESSQYYWMKIFFLLFPTFLFFSPKVNSQARFLAPDTVCVNQPVNITNTSTNASSYYWNFCVADAANTQPQGQNLGNPNGLLSLPVFMDYVQVNNNFYGFVVNLNTNRLVRLDFGNSLLNSPSAINLGDFGGVIPLNAEGIQLVLNEGKWYAIIVGGAQSISTGPRIVKIDFGADITNINPTATNWGNIGGLTYPVDLHVFKENNNWFGFTVNAESNTITRFDFGTSFDITPTGVNLGNVGNLNYPVGIYAISNKGNWHVFITNAGGGGSNSSNSSLTRLDFGNSLLNNPSGTNLGSLNGTLRSPRDLYILDYCNQLIGFITNYSSQNDIVRVNFDSNIGSVPTAVSLGNIGNLNFPHSISRLFRVGPDLFGFVTNAVNNTITRLKFAGCTSANIPNSSVQNPPAIIYNTPGTYNINLTTDDGLPTQSTFCRNVVVMPELPHAITKNLSFCSGDSILLISNFSSRNKWNTGSTGNSIYVRSGGLYWVESSNGGCISRDTFIVTANPAPFQVNLGKDTLICPSDVLVLNAGNPGFSYIWNTGATTQLIKVNAEGSYHVAVSASGCTANDSIIVSFLPRLTVSILPDTVICKNSSIQLSASGGTSYSWSPATTLSDPSVQNPLASPVTNTTYYLTVAGPNGCSNTDSVSVHIWPDPLFSISQPKSICLTDSVQLIASGGRKYIWQPSGSLSNSTISNPTASPNITTTYTVLVSDNCNNTESMSTTITVQALPNVDVSKSNDVDCLTPLSQLQATGGVRYVWSPITNINRTNIHNPIVNPLKDTWYHVVVTDTNECSAEDSVLILTSFVAGSGNFYIPNAFTPNNDGINDCFGLKHWGGMEEFELSIYNRWGERVFLSKNPSDCWNGILKGILQPPGTYIYLVKVKSSCTNGVVQRKGHITLIR